MKAYPPPYPRCQFCSGRSVYLIAELPLSWLYACYKCKLNFTIDKEKPKENENPEKN